MLDKGIVYIPIRKSTTREEMKKIKSKYPNTVVVFLRSGDENMKDILSKFIVLR